MVTIIYEALQKVGYRIAVRPFELNIVGVRANSVQAGAFDDVIHVFYSDEKRRPIHHQYKATTDPGTYWLKNPLHPQGTAILSQGQYVDCYSLGLHRGKYTALVQSRPVTVLRDYDRNAVLDFSNGRPDTGLFGINIHRAEQQGTTKVVDKYSAGCQVFASAPEFAQFLTLCERQRALYGNRFTYTLLDERAVSRQSKKNS